MTLHSELLLAAPPAEDAGEISRQLVVAEDKHGATEHEQQHANESEKQQSNTRVSQDKGDDFEVGHGRLRHLPATGVHEETATLTTTARIRDRTLDLASRESQTGCANRHHRTTRFIASTRSTALTRNSNGAL